MIRLSLFALLLLSAACAGAPEPVPASPAVSPPPPPVMRAPAAAGSNAALFAALPGWSTREIAPGVLAFSRSCGVIAQKPGAAPLSPNAAWAGTASEWRDACRAMRVVYDEASARATIEQLFTPIEIVDPEGAAKFTGYFEPVIRASHVQTDEYWAAIPGPPRDMVQSENGPLQRMRNGSTRPYPPREEIVSTNILGYAHGSDVFFLQIQGSGRLHFEDGREVRAAYHAHNGQPFKSTANWLMERGKISRGEASMQGIRAWMDRVSRSEAVEAMNANPRYVFFEGKPVGDPSLGPAGAETTPLTPLGSMAVDKAYHALGVPFWVQTSAPGLGGDWSGLLVAQDTGGAIKGPVRGDIFFGTGDEAGGRAGTMNAPGRYWALIPKAAAERLRRKLEAGS